MYTGLSTGTHVRLEQRVHPSVYLTAELIQLPLLALEARIEAELAENPFLEIAPSAEESFEREAARDEIDWDSLLAEGHAPMARRSIFEVPEENEREVADRSGDLSAHLEPQLRLAGLPDRELVICLEIIGNLDERGWLACALEEVTPPLTPRASEEELQAALGTVQGLDPAGVGARDLRECLLIQLAARGEGGSLAWSLVHDHYDALLAYDWPAIRRALDVSQDALTDALSVIGSLDPRPGAAFSPMTAPTIVPDLVMVQEGGRWVVRSNDGRVPRLRIARSYQNVIANAKDLRGPDRQFVRERLARANMMRQAIEHRNVTVLEIGRFVMDRQYRFLTEGKSGLVPLTMDEVAQILGVNLSTVSRAVAEKYIRTPHGTFPLRSFFSTALESSTGRVSATAVRERIRTLIGAEDPAAPLDDQALAAQLGREGVKISRRTVTKYREALGIPAARLRQRLSAVGEVRSAVA